MAIVPKLDKPMPEWAKQSIEHLEYVARLLAENGMYMPANYLDRVISMIFRHTRNAP